MKRRSILKSALGVPAAAAMMPAQTTPSGEQVPKLALTSVESVAESVVRFFTPAQFAALKRLGDAIIPAGTARPSASAAGAAEFLDFLIRESPPATQRLYRDGLDRLAAAGSNFDALLEPLNAKWTYNGPSDPFAQFLAQVKSDLLQATINSREFAEMAGRGRRGAGGMTNYYWRAVE